MNRITKHIIITLCFLLTTSQAIHLFCHVLNSDDNNKKEVLHAVENHKCFLCETSLTPLENNHLSETFTWIAPILPWTISEFIIKSEKQHFLHHLKLRGPPNIEIT